MALVLAPLKPGGGFQIRQAPFPIGVTAARLVANASGINRNNANSGASCSDLSFNCPLAYLVRLQNLCPHSAMSDLRLKAG